MYALPYVSQRSKVGMGLYSLGRLKSMPWSWHQFCLFWGCSYYFLTNYVACAQVAGTQVPMTRQRVSTAVLVNLAMVVEQANEQVLSRAPAPGIRAAQHELGRLIAHQQQYQQHADRHA